MKFQNKNLNLFVFFFFIIPFSFSQSIKGFISDSNRLRKYIFLHETIGNQTHKIDSSKISGDGNYLFHEKKYRAGYYVLSLSDTNRADVILNPVEKEVEINFTQPQLQNGIRIISSDENKILWEYKSISKKNYDELKKIYIEKSYLNIPPQNKNDSAIFEKLLEKEDSLNYFKLQELAKICSKYPQSYFAKSAKSALRKKYNSRDEEKQHFFETVDFSDASLLRSVAIPMSIMDYLQKYTDYNEEGFKASVDTILIKAKANSEVYEFCLNYLLELFDRVGPDIIFQYLTEKYFLGDGCSEINVSAQFRNKAESYRILLPGNKAPEIVLNDNFNKEIILSKISAKNKITLLFFWSSHCYFCHNAIPVAMELYKKYNSTGLEIIAVSLDENIGEWEKYIYNSQLKWVNLCDFKGWKSPVIEKYKVHKTPSFFILDSQMTILSKPTSEDFKKGVERYFE